VFHLLASPLFSFGSYSAGIQELSKERSNRAKAPLHIMRDRQPELVSLVSTACIVSLVTRTHPHVVSTGAATATQAQTNDGPSSVANSEADVTGTFGKRKTPGTPAPNRCNTHTTTSARAHLTLNISRECRKPPRQALQVTFAVGAQALKAWP